MNRSQRRAAEKEEKKAAKSVASQSRSSQSASSQQAQRSAMQNAAEAPIEEITYSKAAKILIEQIESSFAPDKVDSACLRYTENTGTSAPTASRARNALSVWTTLGSETPEESTVAEVTSLYNGIDDTSNVASHINVRERSGVYTSEASQSLGSEGATAATTLGSNVLDDLEKQFKQARMNTAEVLGKGKAKE